MPQQLTGDTAFEWKDSSRPRPRSLRSLSPQWHWKEFHKKIVEFVAVSAGDVVLDLGCGRGSCVPPLLDRVGPNGRVVALDRHSGWLQEIAERHAPDIASGRLKITNADLANDLPFREPTFDVIVCQNVLECVRQPNALIEQAARSLKPGGRMLMGHHDFDGVILASDDRDLTRRLVHGFSDFTAAWQDVSDGQMGRLLPGLMMSHTFADVVTETILFVDLALTPESYAQAYIEWVTAAAPRFGICPSDIQKWLVELEESSARGTFYFAVPWVYVIAHVQ